MEMETGISISDAAAVKVAEMIEDMDGDIKLRLYIEGGGCSGFKYGFAFAEEADEADVVIENGEVTMLVDPMSAQYLMGAEVDWVEEQWGAKFTINNPNKTTQCGCGESFTV